MQRLLVTDNCFVYPVVKVEPGHQQASLAASEIIAAAPVLERDNKVATCQTMPLAECCLLAD